MRCSHVEKYAPPRSEAHNLRTLWTLPAASQYQAAALFHAPNATPHVHFPAIFRTMAPNANNLMLRLAASNHSPHALPTTLLAHFAAPLSPLGRILPPPPPKASAASPPQAALITCTCSLDRNLAAPRLLRPPTAAPDDIARKACSTADRPRRAAPRLAISLRRSALSHWSKKRPASPACLFSEMADPARRVWSERQRA